MLSRETRDFGSVGLERGMGPGGSVKVGGGLEHDLGRG